MASGTLFIACPRPTKNLELHLYIQDGVLSYAFIIPQCTDPGEINSLITQQFSTATCHHHVLPADHTNISHYYDHM
jgi:hypothetical protein